MKIKQLFDYVFKVFCCFMSLNSVIHKLHLSDFNTRKWKNIKIPFHNIYIIIAIHFKLSRYMYLLQIIDTGIVSQRDKMLTDLVQH